MSNHQQLFRSGAHVIDRHFSSPVSATYRTSDGKSITLDATIGGREFVDEQAMDGEYKVERVRIRFAADQLRSHGITTVQGAAVVIVENEEWNILVGESQYGRSFVVLQLVRVVLHRRNQMRML